MHIIYYSIILRPQLRPRYFKLPKHLQTGSHHISKESIFLKDDHRLNKMAVTNDVPWLSTGENMPRFLSRLISRFSL